VRALVPSHLIHPRVNLANAIRKSSFQSSGIRLKGILRGANGPDDSVASLDNEFHPIALLQSQPDADLLRHRHLAFAAYEAVAGLDADPSVSILARF
jgi:hypothetical protein